MRHAWQTGRDAVGTVGAICATAALLAGCGSSSGPASHGARISTVSLARAADVSSSSQGYRVAIKMHETVPGAGAVSLTGRGSFSPARHLGAMTMRMSVPTSAGARSMRMQMVLGGQTVYMRLPAQAAATIPGARPWLSIDLAQATKAAGISGLGSLMSSSQSISDPGQYLDFLRATSTGSVKDLGRESVGGRSTTHYRAEVDIAKLLDSVPAADRRSAQELVASLESEGMRTQMPIDVWIDGSLLVRRVELSFTQPLPTGQSASLSMTEDFVAYGPQAAPAIPSPSQTTNALSLLNQAG